MKHHLPIGMLIAVLAASVVVPSGYTQQTSEPQQVNMYDAPVTLPLPKVINLLTDLKEERDVGAKNSWIGIPMTKILVDFEQSLKKYPPIKAGTPDPYVPGK